MRGYRWGVSERDLETYESALDLVAAESASRQLDALEERAAAAVTDAHDVYEERTAVLSPAGDAATPGYARMEVAQRYADWLNEAVVIPAMQLVDWNESLQDLYDTVQDAQQLGDQQRSTTTRSLESRLDAVVERADAMADYLSYLDERVDRLQTAADPEQIAAYLDPGTDDAFAPARDMDRERALAEQAIGAQWTEDAIDDADHSTALVPADTVPDY